MAKRFIRGMAEHVLRSASGYPFSLRYDAETEGLALVLGERAVRILSPDGALELADALRAWVTDGPEPMAVGDVVSVKGSAVSMTINDIRGSASDEVECLWFVGATLHRGWFSRDVLERAS